MTLTQNNLRDMLAAKHKPFNLKEFILDAIVCVICLAAVTIAVGLCFAAFQDAATTIENPARKYYCAPTVEKPHPFWAMRLKGGAQ